MRLQYQLFLTLLGASAVLVLLMYALSSFGFSRGFLAYVNQNEADRLTPISEKIVERYEATGNWSFVNNEYLRTIMRESSREGNRNSRRRGDDDELFDIEPAPPPPSTGRRQRSNRPLPRITLSNADNVLLVGKKIPSNMEISLPLESNGVTIGYLNFQRLGRVNREFDQIFEKQQKKLLGLTSLAMIILSGLLSIPLASRMVKPLLTVNNAVGEISGGNYAHKVSVTRDDEIGDLANKINLLGRSLEQNRDARQRWIAEISHELRTPLAVLRGEIEAVQDGVRDLDKKAIDSLHGEVLSLGRLIDDLHTLSVSDVGALDYHMETFNLAEMLSVFLESHQELLNQKSLSLEKHFMFDRSTLSSSTNIVADKVRLEQLFSNLLQNTCRYTDEDGELEVTLRKSQGKNGESIVVEWQDSTPGVSLEEIPKLFDPLYRTESSRNRKLGGSGLGLSIAKRIVEAHSGTIAAAPSPTGGLHIQIELPLAARSA